MGEVIAMMFMRRIARPEHSAARLLRSVALAGATLLWTASPASAVLIFSNFDQSTVMTSSSGVILNQPVTEFEMAMRFVATTTALVGAVTVPVFTPGEAGSYVPQPPPGTAFGNSMRVAIYADSSAVPGALLEIAEAPDSVPLWDGVSSPMPAPVTTNFSGSTLLVAGQAYWVGLIETESTALSWLYSDSMPETHRLMRQVGGTWGFTGFLRSGLQVHAVPGPGAGGAAALGCMLALLPGRRRPVDAPLRSRSAPTPRPAAARS